MQHHPSKTSDVGVENKMVDQTNAMYQNLNEYEWKLDMLDAA